MKRKSLQILRSVTEEEQKYTYAQNMQIREQTGNIGYLRGDFGSDGNSFYSTWFDQCKSLKTDEFKLRWMWSFEKSSCNDGVCAKEPCQLIWKG